MALDRTISESAYATNTGNRSGDESVKLYLPTLKSKVERSREELEGFERVSLEPNQTKTVEIPLKASQLAYWDKKIADFKVESEPVKLMIGDSSADIKLQTTIPVL